MRLLAARQLQRLVGQLSLLGMREDYFALEPFAPHDVPVRSPIDHMDPLLKVDREGHGLSIVGLVRLGSRQRRDVELHMRAASFQRGESFI
jgi:hypothetical protein